MNAFISYEGLPLNSGGAHSLGTKPCDKIHAECVHFLQMFTNNEMADYIVLTFHGSRDRTYKSLPSVWRLAKRFGVPTLGSWQYATGRRRTYTWYLKSVKDVEDGLQLLDAFASYPPNDPSPLVLSFMWRFYFIDPDTKEVLPGQDKIPMIDSRLQNSQLYLRLGQKSTVSAWFTFPFEEWNEQSKLYIRTITSGAPFKCADKHWRLWKYSNNGKWFPRSLDISI